MRTRLPARARPRSLVSLVVAAILVLAGLASVTVATQQSASAASRSLRVSPSTYVAGQMLSWSGNVGAPGARTLVVQFNMGRPGDAWATVRGFHSTTTASGGFRFTFPAPGMFGILYRVKAGTSTSPAKTFSAKTPDITVEVTGQPSSGLTGGPGLVNPDEPFGLTVDATPDGLYRSPTSDDLPVFPGRVMTLIRRVDGDTWTTVARTTEDSTGRGYFTGLTEPAGTSVYRVRQESVTTNGSRIGWNQTFPLYVLSGQAAENDYSALRDNTPASTPVASSSGSAGAATPNAGTVQGWTPSLFDFAWEAGESLDSPPSRGTDTRAHWLGYSDGSGRVQKHSGGLLLDSKRYNGAGPGDFGTTRATVVDAGMTQGRWEARLRVRSAFERGGNQYRILAELVPSDPAQYACGAHNVTIASLDPFTRTYSYGVRSATSSWRGTAEATRDPLHASDAFGVELAGSRITWFLNGQPVGSVLDSAAIPGVPMTLRLSLEGKGQQEMDQVSVISDWIRGFPISTGRHPVSSHRLPRTDASPPAC